MSRRLGAVYTSVIVPLAGPCGLRLNEFRFKRVDKVELVDDEHAARGQRHKSYTCDLEGSRCRTGRFPVIP